MSSPSDPSPQTESTTEHYSMFAHKVPAVGIKEDASARRCARARTAADHYVRNVGLAALEGRRRHAPAPAYRRDNPVYHLPLSRR